MSQDPQSSNQQPLPWGSAPTPNQGGYPQPGYPQQPGYQQPGYPPQSYPPAGPPQAPGLQGYPQPQPYPTQAPYQNQPQYQTQPPYYPTAPTPAKSPIVGIIALAVVAIALAGSLVGAVPLAQAMGELVATTGSTTITPEDIPVSAQQALMGPMSAVMGLSVLGLAGWITGIVAAISGRGRIWGVIAVVLGVAAPFIILLVMAAGLAPYLPTP